MNFTVKDRFIKYVQIDTQSDPVSTSQPSTLKQLDLSKVLVQELKEMGLSDVELDEFGYVYATIPATTSKKNVPVICFCAHVDTAPDASGTGVKPIIHSNYQGQDIVLPDDTSVVIRMTDYPYLKDKIGHDIITASGLTLLGGDDKAGVAEIMDAAYQLINNPSIKHGKIRLLFTPDEEIGRGVDEVDIKKLGADFGYTLDGGPIGTLEDETFSADGAVITIQGVAAHPGYAKGKMENAVKIASDIVSALPKHRLTPETTQKKQGFIHPVKIEGGLENAKITFILRDFEEDLLKEKSEILRKVMDKVLLRYPHSSAKLEVFEQYRNMKQIVSGRPEIIEYAKEAIKRSGLKPQLGSIRGGTDGSRLSFMGLPCPNLFAGEMAIHSRQEFVTVQDMQKAVETIINIVAVCEERS
ncbi:MAG TPA: peptidase T [Saprospiraceae bacterium]|nr:peptidase T [Saprospiraceae bacterium]HMX82716.1 peptidase T [Saprospiraceae bacterium]HMX85877.1 peptidase T [Saprospiraceae bacterium]HNA41225.1 peptidase T [Saprospiraceae bacterium]HND16217.1 peptidase T [Saprospiraceae bacterium]